MPERRALLISENAPVPSDRRVWNEARALRDAGWDVTVVCAQGETRDCEPSATIDGIAIHRYPLTPAAGGLAGYAREYLQALWRIRRITRRLARERRFDVVHAGNPPDLLLLAVRGLRRHGTAFVFDHHDVVPELYQSKFGGDTGLMYRVALAQERIAFRLADVVICTNESYRAIALQRGARHPQDVFVVRNGPDTSRFAPVDPNPELRRGRRHLIGYLGIMGPQDGADHAIRALAALRRRRDDWHAVFMGDGESLPAIRSLVAELEISDHVELAGWCDDDRIRATLSTCDVCVAPDPPSPLNNVSTMIKIPEYLAMGCPVVSYDLAESRASAGDAARYATPGDTEALGELIDQLLDDPQQRAAMGMAGQARVHDALAWQHQIPALLGAYARAIGTPNNDGAPVSSRRPGPPTRSHATGSRYRRSWRSL